jgi:cell division protease FtsH
MDGSVNLQNVAARTTGFSGASLANVLNEAAIVAARRGKDAVSSDEVNYALDRVTVGLEKRTGMASDKRKKLVAVHEAGHAVTGILTPSFDEVGKVTIVPRSGGAGGFTLFTPADEQQDSGLYSRRYLQDQLAVALGGRVAEELTFGEDEITTGASTDFQKVAEVARKMVTQWGFSTSALGYTAWEPTMEGWMGQRMASEATQTRIDAEVEVIVARAYSDCKTKLSSNRAALDAVAGALVEQETLEGDEIRRIVDDNKTSTAA